MAPNKPPTRADWNTLHSLAARWFQVPLRRIKFACDLGSDNGFMIVVEDSVEPMRAFDGRKLPEAIAWFREMLHRRIRLDSAKAAARPGKAGGKW